MAVVMDADVEAAEAIARRMIEKVRCQQVAVGSSFLKITLDCGIAGYPVHGQTGKQLIQRALAALDLATAAGRGTCVVFDPEQEAAMRAPQRDASREVF